MTQNTQNIVDSSATTDYSFSHRCIDADLHYLTLTKGSGTSSDVAGPLVSAQQSNRLDSRTEGRAQDSAPRTTCRDRVLRIREFLPWGAFTERNARDQAKIKGGIRCVDAKSLHGLRRAPLTPPEPFHPKAFRSTQLQIPEPFVADAPPDPKTLCREHSSRSEDPSSWTLRRIRRPFVVNTPPSPGSLGADVPPDPKTLCRERSSRSEDPSLRNMSIGIKPLRCNKKIHSESNFLWINC